MPTSSSAPRADGRPSRTLALALAAGLAVGMVVWAAGPVDGGRQPGREAQLRFMWAMAGQESGWDYYARNSSSGAFGKYQIMPFNWPAWAGDYLGDRKADQTPYNQEKVAYGKLRDLHGWLGSWKRVAYWWLTGSSEQDQRKWSSYAKGYVSNIMRLRKRAPKAGWRMPPRTSSKAGAGDWRRAAEGQALRLSAGGRPWAQRGGVRDGQLVRVTAGTTTRVGVRWLRVVTADGRRGWLPQPRTVPARKPAAASRWRDVRDTGATRDRRHVRPRPR